MQNEQRVLTPKVIKTLYHDVDHSRLGNQLSRQHRSSVVTSDKDEDKSLTYGEIDPVSFLQILDLAVRNLPKGTVVQFCDLGSGTGKAVLTAALSSFGFVKVMGIEIVPGLHELAVSSRDTLLSAITNDINMNRQSIVANNVKPTQKEKRTSAISSLSSSELVDRITTILIDSGSPTVSIEDIGNKLVKMLGHKTYTASLKPFGKLSRCIAQQVDRFIMLDDGMMALIAVETVVTTNTTGEETSENTLSVDSSNSAIAIPAEEPIDTSTTDSSNSATTIPAEEPIGYCVFDTLSSVFQQHPGSAKTYHTLLPEIEFLCGDIFDSIKWQKDCNIVYTASLLFTEEMMDRLLVCVRGLTPPAVFITLKPLPLIASDKEFIHLFEESFFKMSWQLAKVYFYIISFASAGEKSIT